MMKNRMTPWAWVPTLYFAEGLPNVIVMSVAVVMYMQLGMTDTDIALYTSWLGLPWVIKPFWSPFVDLYRTKRWWVLAMQILLGSSLAGVAFTLNAAFWFQGTMFFFFLMAFSSATHDIAADGYYMLELDDHAQTWFVGIRNTFYRIAVIMGKGLLVPAAGMLQLIFRNQKAFTWSLVFYGLAGLFIAIWLYHGFIMPRPEDDAEKKDTSASEVMAGMKKMFVAFIGKMPGREMLAALCFLLFYRFPEAMLSKMTDTFLLRPNSEGGLGLSPQEYCLANRAPAGRHRGWNARQPRRTEALVVAYGVRHHAARHRLCVHELCHALQRVGGQCIPFRRTVWLRPGLHGPYPLHALFQPRSL